jgi:hypothetical protein
LNEYSSKRGKHSKILIKAYRLYLLGESSFEELNISESEIATMKKFHERVQGGQSSYMAGKALRLPEFLSKGMGLMYCDWCEGKEIRDLYPSNENRPRIARTYELMISGVSERRLQDDGFSDYEIDKASLF